MIIARGVPGVACARSREAKTWACGTGPGPTVITNAMGVGTVALPRVRARERKWWAFGTGEVVEWLGAAPVHLMNETLSLPPECGASEVHAGCTPVRDSRQPLAYATDVLAEQNAAKLGQTRPAQGRTLVRSAVQKRSVASELVG